MESFSSVCLDYGLFCAWAGLVLAGSRRLGSRRARDTFSGEDAEWALPLAVLAGSFGLALFSSAGVIAGAGAFLLLAGFGVLGLTSARATEPSGPRAEGRGPSENQRGSLRIDRWVARALFAIASGYWLWHFRDLASLPSIGDGLNHLFYFTRIVETGQLFTGHIPLLQSGEFGPQNLEFYPSGTHALAAMTTAPLRWAGVSNLSALKIFFVAVLSAFPPILFRGLRRARPELSRGEAALLAAMASTVAIFPFRAIGEGGFSRVTAQILTWPLAWRMLTRRGQLSGGELGLLLGVVFPTSFLLHPSAVFLPGAILALTIRESRTQWLKPAGLARVTLGASVAVVYLAAALGTGAQYISRDFMAEKIYAVIPWSFAALFERWKGPFHHIFSDGLGFGKFLSPRSLLAYGGVALLARGFRPEWRRITLGLLVFPFALSLLAFLPGKLPSLVGMLYYHDINRFAELGLAPLLLLASLSVERLRVALPAARIVVGMLILAVTAVGAQRGAKLLNDLDAIYASVRTADVDILLAKLRGLPRDRWIACRHQWAELLPCLPDQPRDASWLTLGVECAAGTGVEVTPHCKNRATLFTTLEAAAAADPTGGSFVQLGPSHIDGDAGRCVLR